MKKRILLVEDEENFRDFMHTVLADEGYDLLAANDGLSGLRLLKRERVDLVISDLKMPGMNGIDLFKAVMQEPNPPLFVFLTAFGTVEEAVTAMKDGAFDFLTKPLKDMESLLDVVKRALASRLATRECLTCLETDSAGLPPSDIIFAGRTIQAAHTLVHNVAPTSATVLISGESGTGKELVARVIHLLSLRSNAAFVPLNCAAIPENLLESELFGHEKGAFTGAVQARQGKFELAAGGTIFLDEIGDMPLSLQAKLLRVLQERTFERVGGSREIKADVRVIAATNRNLEECVAQKSFREDLFYRLNVFPIKLPPLRERQDSIPPLADYFLQRFCKLNHKKLKGIEPEALACLQTYLWPGNIRELQNVMERAVILADSVIRPHNLPDGIVQNVAMQKAEGRGILKTVERDLIIKALERHHGNRQLAADDLQMSRRSLQYKLKEYGLLD
jgi:DNA-binding NtrC family response regulator